MSYLPHHRMNDIRNTGQVSNNQPLPHTTLTPTRHLSEKFFSHRHFYRNHGSCVQIKTFWEQAGKFHVVCPVTDGIYFLCFHYEIISFPKFSLKWLLHRVQPFHLSEKQANIILIPISAILSERRNQTYPTHFLW